MTAPRHPQWPWLKAGAIASGLWMIGLLLTAPAAAAEPGTAPAKIVCFGDSITQRGYPKALGRLLKTDPINAGVPGNTTAQALRRMPEDVLAHDPDVVVILFGTNDSRIDNAKVHVPVDKYRANLEQMIKACTRNKARVVLCTVPPINPEPYFKRHEKKTFDAAGGLARLLAEYRAAALRVAASRKVPVVDLNQILLREPGWMGSDGVHPRKRGNTIIARHIAEAVRPLLGAIP